VIRYTGLTSIIISTAVLLLLVVSPSAAEVGKTFDTFTVYWENDFVAGTDRDYTNGLKFTWSTPYKIDEIPAHWPRWSHGVINSLPFVSDPDAQRALSVSLGQNIYTPYDITRSGVIADDRPYAGITYLAIGFHGIKGNHRMNWEIDMGMIGPLSFAEKTQTSIHRIIGSQQAQGWSHQLHNELGLEVIGESQWRAIHGENTRGINYDLISHLGGRIGNVQIYANTGAEARVGWNLPNDFGSCPIRPGCETNSGDIERKTDGRLGVHLFTAIDGRVVIRDIFLDGNTWGSSQSVDKELFVADMMAGFALEYGKFKLRYSYVLRTKQFKTQQREQIFGTLSLSWIYD
jgi:lipid A 3-O-deacylase